MYLEGTGSMVFDYQNKTIYACLSPRTNTCLVELVGQKLGYDTIIFRASDKLGRPIYHTNVMMWIGESVAAVCTDAISSHEVQGNLPLEEMYQMQRTIRTTSNTHSPELLRNDVWSSTP